MPNPSNSSMSTLLSKQPHSETETIAPNWFSAYFRNRPEEHTRESKALTLFCKSLKHAKYPKDIREAIRLAVRVLEERRGYNHNLESPHNSNKTILRDLVDLFWPMQVPYDKSPFYQSAWSLVSSELCRFCLSLWILYAFSTGRQRYLTTTQLPIHTHCSQVGLGDLIRQVELELESNSQCVLVWPFHTLMTSHHSVLDLTRLAMSYLAPHVALWNCAQEILEGGNGSLTARGISLASLGNVPTNRDLDSVDDKENANDRNIGNVRQGKECDKDADVDV